MSQPTESPAPLLLTDLIRDFVADTDAAASARANGVPRGIVTGFTDIDADLGSFLMPGIHILQGGPGSGKSALALQIAANCFYPALFVSAEMGLIELFRRTIARETGTYLGRLKNGEISGEKAANLAVETVKKVPKLALMDSTKVFVSRDAMQKAAEGLRTRFKSDHILIVLDSLHVWARSSRQSSVETMESSEYDTINNGIDAISTLAANLKCPVLAIAHRNREGNKSKAAGLHSSKGSGDLEYSAETVIDLNRQKDDTDSKGEVEVTATAYKNRNGVVGKKYSFQFEPRLQKFREI
jgi:replicative DNA helicase